MAAFRLVLGVALSVAMLCAHEARFQVVLDEKLRSMKAKIKQEAMLIKENSRHLATAKSNMWLTKRVRKLLKEMDILETALASSVTSSDLSDLATRVSTVETDVRTLKTGVTLCATSSHVSGLATRVSTVERDVATLDTDVALCATSPDLSGLETRVSTVETDVTTLETSVQSLRTDLDDTAASRMTVPTSKPTLQIKPTFRPTENRPTLRPTLRIPTWPAAVPAVAPSEMPLPPPSATPSLTPTQLPTSRPTHVPSMAPSGMPLPPPSATPSGPPTQVPTSRPTPVPSMSPSGMPLPPPSATPSKTPTQVPAPEDCGLDIGTTCLINGVSCETYIPVTVCLNRPLEMKMLYKGGDCADSYTSQTEPDFTCSDLNGGIPSGSSVHITVEGFKGESVYFDGSASEGNVITLSDAGERFQAMLKFVVMSSDQTTTYQEVAFHSSCSQFIYLKDQFGALQVVEWTNELQGIISSYQNATFGFDISSADQTSTLGTGAVDTTIGNGMTTTKDVTAIVAGMIVSPADPSLFELVAILDLTSLQTYQVNSTVEGTDVDTGSSCSSSGSASFLIGYERPT